MKKSRFSVELLKQLFFIISNILWTLLKSNWKALYTTFIKVSFVTTLIVLITLIPSGVTSFLSIPGWLGWFSIIFIWRLLNLKYDDFETPEENDELTDENINDMVDEIPPIAPNIASSKEMVTNDPTAPTSTRE